MLLVTEANYGNEMVGLLRAVFHLVQDWPRKKRYEFYEILSREFSAVFS